MGKEYVKDPISTEIIRNAFLSAAEEMCESLFRSSYTPIIYEAKDCAVGLYNEKLEVLGQSTGVPLFLGNLQETIRYAVEYYGGVDKFNEGDVFILNDCYISGTHLNDVTVFAPIFYQKEIVGFSANRAHWIDVGSKDPMAPMDSTNVFQEGFRMGPLKIIDKGEPRMDLIDTICMNSRFPKNVRGDLNAQIAGCKTGEKRLKALIDRFGIDTIRSATEDIFEQTVMMEREILKKIPAGVYEEEGFLDNDGVGTDPIVVKLKLTINEEGNMNIDLTGSSPMAVGSTNCGLAQTISACRVAYKMLVLPNAPVTGGSFRGLTIQVPPKSVFWAEEPAAFSWYFSHLGLLIDLIIKAISKAAPEMAAGAHYGDSMVCYVSGTDPKTGELYALDEPTIGGWGANAEMDGQDCLINIQNGDFKNFPAEVQERKYPLLMTEYAIRENSEGPGKNRGGLGVKRSYKILADNTNIYLWFERSKMPAWGVFGGQSALGPEVEIVNEKGDLVEKLLKVNNMPIPKGWTFRMRTGGGGGYGDPKERDPEKVRKDVEFGYISRERAATVYGVSINENGDIDEKETAELRK